MNLVAKEYVAAQAPDDPGVLVLSQFAGAAHELKSALIVNPYDVEAMADALVRAFAMRLDERKDRWQAMMAVLRANSVHDWAARFLETLTAEIAVTKSYGSEVWAAAGAARPEPRTLAPWQQLVLGADTRGSIRRAPTVLERASSKRPSPKAPMESLSKASQQSLSRRRNGTEIATIGDATRLLNDS
jgi:hypothetical protein